MPRPSKREVNYGRSGRLLEGLYALAAGAGVSAIGMPRAG